MKKLILRLLFPKEKVAKQINSVLRKLILAAAALLATKSDYFLEFAAYLTQNVDPLAAQASAAIMAAIAVLWGTKEKK